MLNCPQMFEHWGYSLLRHEHRDLKQINRFNSVLCVVMNHVFVIPSGGTRKVADGDGDRVTGGEGIQNAPSSWRATPGPRWNAWLGTDGTGGASSVAYAPKWSRLASDQIRFVIHIYIYFYRKLFDQGAIFRRPCRNAIFCLTKKKN